PAANRVAGSRPGGRENVVAQALQIPKEHGRSMPDRPRPDQRRRTAAVDHDLVRAGAQDFTGRGVVPDALGNVDWQPRTHRLLLSVGCDRTAVVGHADLLRQRAVHDTGRLFQRRVNRWGVGVLPAGSRPTLLRRWCLRDHRTYLAEVWPARLRASGMGLGYGAGNLGKILGPLGLALIVGSSNYLSPQAT